MPDYLEDLSILNNHKWLIIMPGMFVNLLYPQDYIIIYFKPNGNIITIYQLLFFDPGISQNRTR
jgi:hypothetical protein